jgi:hypothetical protein
MKFLAGYIGIFSTSALIGLVGVADKVPEAGALVVLAGVLIYILKAHREDRKEFLVEIKELRKGITELSTQLKEHRNNHED